MTEVSKIVTTRKEADIRILHFRKEKKGTPNRKRSKGGKSKKARGGKGCCVSVAGKGQCAFKRFGGKKEQRGVT